MHDAVLLVTDYGADDTYGAALVGACWRVEPSLRCVAGTHGVPAGDALAGAYHIKAVAAAFPPGTVICAVVDPEVGTARRAVAVAAGGVRCVAPDTGLVSYLWAEAAADERACVAVDTSAAASPTFHGRDVFAPVAARLACGAGLDSIGPRLDAPRLLDEAFCRDAGGALEGRVALADHFGNAVTTIRVADLRGRRPLRATWPGGGTDLVVTTYAHLGDRLGLLAGSAGHLELAAAGVPAAARGGPAPGTAVRVEVAG